MPAMAGSPDSDRMDWTPSKVTIIYPNPLKAARERRKFDEIVDDTTPYGRDDVARQQYEYQRYRPYGNDSNMGVIPRFGRRLAIWVCGITYIAVVATVAAFGTPLEYTASSIKRRLIRKTQDRAADARTTTPRRRKYRNIYLTPRKVFEQQSPRSCRIRDIPGRFPGTPLTTYSPNLTSPPRTPYLSLNISPSPDMQQLPCRYPASPLQQKCERRPAKETLLQQPTIQAAVQNQQTGTKVGNTSTGDLQNEVLDLGKVWAEYAQRVSQLDLPYDEISELEELEEPEEPYDPAKDPALAIAPGVREYGQVLEGEALIVCQVPKPELRFEGRKETAADNDARKVSSKALEIPPPTANAVTSSINHSQALLSLGPGRLNARRSKPKTSPEVYKEPVLISKVSKKPRSALASRSKPSADGLFGIKKLVRAFRNPLPKSAKKNVGFFESPKTGGPVTRIKRFAIGETIDCPSPTSTRDESSMISNYSTGIRGGGVTDNVSIDNMLLQMASLETGSSSDPVTGGQLHNDSVDEQGRNIGNAMIENDGHTQASPNETLSSKSSSSSLRGVFEGLDLSPRRTSIRQHELAEKEAIEQAAREKKEAEERARLEKEDAELRVQLEREHEEHLIRRGVRRLTKEPIIKPLTPKQEEKLDKAMAKGEKVKAMNGNDLGPSDWNTILPPDGWLNDNIIVAYLEHVVQMAHERAGLQTHQPPKMHAFNNSFFNNLRTQGHNGVARWTRRPRIPGTKLLPLEYIFIPVNASGNHWTLAVISPIRRTIEYFDSLHIPGQPEKVVALMRVWLKGELGDAYNADEWTVRESEGPHQGNFSDCGVHTITTAKLIALGIDPMAAPAEVMAIQRRRIVAELLHKGFRGEFAPEFEYA